MKIAIFLLVALVCLLEHRIVCPFNGRPTMHKQQIQDVMAKIETSNLFLSSTLIQEKHIHQAKKFYLRRLMAFGMLVTWVEVIQKKKSHQLLQVLENGAHL